MNWPSALVTELAARRCIIFAGAGASAGCLASDGNGRPPLWKKFLNTLKDAAPTGADVGVIDTLLNKERYLDAAEVILNKITPAEFSRVLREQLVKPKFSPSKIHEAILDIDPKIVVTTNYDDIYDNFCRSGMAADGYNVCKYYDGHLVNDLRSPVRLIIKSHGCVSDPSRVVLTRSQYFQQRQQFGSFFNVLNALFVTNTILFLGYSLSDPDIQLVLENATIAAQCSHRHYALVEDNIPPDIEQASTNAYNIQFIRYKTGKHSEAERALIELAERVKQLRVTNPA